MKRFLMIDESGRGDTEDWTAREIRQDIDCGGGFADYNEEQTDENDVEPISSWMERCDVGAEYDLDAARLVCVADDADAPSFNVETSADGATLVLRSPIGEMVATITMAHHTHALPGDVGARLGANWRTLVGLLTTEIK